VTYPAEAVSHVGSASNPVPTPRSERCVRRSLHHEHRGFEIAPIDLAGFISDIEIWISSTATWIAEHMGEAALSRFTDRSGWRSAHFPAALNPDHGRAISLLNVYRTNLRALIEAEAWS
jgi:hypothetical protein